MFNLHNADFMQGYQPRLADGSKPIHHTEIWYAEAGEPIGGGFVAEYAETKNPAGWQAWALWQESDDIPQPWDPDNRVGLAKPEFRLTETEHKRHVTGDHAAMWFTYRRIHHGGLYQLVDAAGPDEDLRGQRVRFSIAAHAWCGSGNPDESLPGKGRHVFSEDGLQAAFDAGEISRQTYDDHRAFTFYVGIDPTGGTDPTANTVVWSPGWHIYNEYVRFGVEVDIPADADEISVWVRSRATWRVTHNDAYIDAARLEIVSDTPPPPPPSPPTPPASSQSKLGPHVLAGADGLEAWLDARPTVAKVAGHLGAAELAHPDTLVIGRVITDHIPGMFLDEPRTVARWLVEEQRAQYEANPRIEFWEGPNEFNPGTPEQMRWLSTMEAERTRLLADMGLRAVIFNFSTGCPDLDLWDYAKEALQAIEEHGGLIGLHEYSGGYMQWLCYNDQPPGGDAVNGGWLTLRYRLIHDRYLAPAGYGHLPIVITEAGLDSVAPAPPGCEQTGAWRDMAGYWTRAFSETDPAAFYTEQLLWYEEQLRQDPYVIGATVFTLGATPGWEDFDVAGDVAEALAAYVPETPGTPEDPQRGAPRVQYERTYVLLPPDTDVTLHAAAAIGAHPWGLTVGRSADDAAVGNLDTRRVRAVNPDRWPDPLEDFFKTYYPGAVFEALHAATPAELVVKLAPALDPKDLERLAVNQRAYEHDLGEDPGGETIGSHGCLLSDLTISLRRVYGRAVGPVEINEVFTLTGDVFTSDDLLTNWHRLPAHFPAFDDAMKVNRGYTAAELAGLQAQGWEITLAVNGGKHFVYYVGSLSGDQVQVIDPWGGEVKAWATSDIVGIRALHVAGVTGDDEAPVTPNPTPPAPTPPEPSSSLRGVHGAPVTTPANAGVWIERLDRMGLHYLKILDDGAPQNAGNVAFAGALKNAGFEPVVRLYCGEQAPHRLFDLKPGLKARVKDYVSNGIRYFEILNEPNLAHEWAADYQGQVDWHDARLIQTVTEAWLKDAVTVIDLGGRPAFPAMAPTERNRGTHPRFSSWQWATRMLDLLAFRYKARVTEWLRAGDLWLAVHTADFGRAFNYPAVTAEGLDDMCLLGYEPLQTHVARRFGVTPVTMSTEGGVYSPSHLGNTPPDGLGWPVTYTEEAWGPRVKAMFEFLEQRGTLAAMMPWTGTDERVHDPRWLHCGWFDASGNPRSPAIALGY